MAVKVMSIISYVITGISFLCLVAFNDAVDYEAAIGWGMILALWTIAYTIVVHVSSNKCCKK